MATSVPEQFDKRIDDWALHAATWLQSREFFLPSFRAQDRALRKALRCPELMSSVFQMLADLAAALHGRGFLSDDDYSDLADLSDARTALEHSLASMRASGGQKVPRGRPARLTVPVYLMLELVRTGWTVHGAATYVAKRIATVWEGLEQRHHSNARAADGADDKVVLSEPEVRELWGGWWATDEMARPKRVKKLREALRLAYLAHFKKRGGPVKKTQRI